MPKRKEPELTPEEQFERFRDTARKLGVDETGKKFEREFTRLTPEVTSKDPSKPKDR